MRVPIAIVAPDADLDRAAGLRTVLVKRGFAAVRVAPVESYRPASETVVYLMDEGDTGLAVLCRQGLGSGLIYSTGRVQVPAGEWTLANSPITLYSRLRELIAYNRAAA